MSKKLYVGNLAYSVTEAMLRELFATVGNVASAAVITERDTGRSKGFAFVEMSTEEEARQAITQLNGKTLAERAITVAEAREQAARSGGGGYGNRGGYGGNRGGRSDRGGRGGGGYRR